MTDYDAKTWAKLPVWAKGMVIGELIKAEQRLVSEDWRNVDERNAVQDACRCAKQILRGIK